MPSLWTRIRSRAVRGAFPLLFRADSHRADLVRLGTPYGGWWVPGDLLGPESICYAGGVGMDISFDLALIDTYGCRVWGIDPTPQIADWIASQDLDPRFSHVPVGLSGRTEVVRFYAPERPDHISHSIKNLQRTTAFFEAEVLTIGALMRRLGHTRVDLVKLDIEGAEHETIAQMLQDGIRPSVVCVEYDQPEPLAWGLATTRRLRAAGYDLCRTEGLNLTFVLRQ